MYCSKCHGYHLPGHHGQLGGKGLPSHLVPINQPLREKGTKGSKVAKLHPASKPLK
jgi:hypothetical protein